MPRTYGADAVVIGAGPNGLVCANLLADAGWDVVVLEAAPQPGGAVSSAGYLGEGFVADVCSAFYPLAAASPAISALHLEDHGLRWCHAPAVLANPLPGGGAAVVWRDLEKTAAGLDANAAGDGESWRQLYDLWKRVKPGVIRSLFSPSPPLRGALQVAAALGPSRLLRFARFATLPVRRLAEEQFHGIGAGMLLAGCALHTDLSPEALPGAAYGWLLAMLAQDVGFPLPQGGAARLAEAMVRRLESRGGRVRCSTPASEVVVRGGRAVGVRTSSGEELSVRKAVMADVSATSLYGGLVRWEHLPAGLKADMSHFQWDPATVKLDWAVEGGIPWREEVLGAAGTVHLADSVDDMTRYCADIATGVVPSQPFMLVGQMTTSDPTRSPAGTEVVWAYTHVPRRVRGDAGGEGISGAWDERDRLLMAQRLEARIEQHAPGFRSRVRQRHLLCPGDLEAHDANLVGGALNGGTSGIHQQLVFRPTPGLGRPETPVQGLYLASAAVHPGGGVHGACGANAARAALSAQGLAGRLVRGPVMAGAQRVARGY